MTARLVALTLLFGTILIANPALTSNPASRVADSSRTRQNSATDNWLGGFGIWSNPYHWSGGVPGANSDVYIATGDDHVSLDVHSNIASLWLGGPSGTSTLDGTLGQSLTISSTLTINEPGTLYLGNGAYLYSPDITNNGSIELFTSRDQINAQTLTNYSGGDFSINFGHGSISQITNYGRVDVHNGQATLDVSGNFDNYGTTNVVMRAQLGIAGSFANYAGSTLNVDGPGASASASQIVNSGTISQYGGAISTPSLVNGGTIQADHGSTIQVGTGKTGGAGYYQFADGIFVEVVGASSFGVLTIDGPAMLDGELDILLDNGFVPVVGSTYDFLSFAPGELVGGFEAIQDPYFNHGLEMWTLKYDNVSGLVQLIAVPTPEPGSILLIGSGLLALAGKLRRKPYA